MVQRLGDIKRGGRTHQDTLEKNLVVPTLKDAVAGEIEFVDYDDNILLAHIQREANATYIKLQMKDCEPVVRYLADKNWTDLVYTFGFCYNKERDIPLQIVDDDSPLLFLSTSNKVNAELINTAMSDESASVALEQFEEVLKQATAFHMQSLNTISVYKQTVKSFPIYDVDSLTKVKNELERHYDLLNLPKLPDMTPVHILDIKFPEIPDLPDMSKVHVMDIHFPNMPELPDMSKVHYVDMYFPNIPEFEMPWFIDIDCTIPDITSVIAELKELKAGRCPTCGKPWVD